MTRNFTCSSNGIVSMVGSGPPVQRPYISRLSPAATSWPDVCRIRHMKAEMRISANNFLFFIVYLFSVSGHLHRSGRQSRVGFRHRFVFGVFSPPGSQ